MKKHVYSWFSKLLTLIYVMGASALFFTYLLNLPSHTAIISGAVVGLPMMMVALNLMMNVWMTYKGIFDRKLQGWVFPTIIYMYNFAIIYVYMEGNQMTLTMDILRLFIISIGVGMSLSILNVILGLFANRSYRKGWFTVMTAIMGIVSVLSGYHIFHQLMKL